MGNPDEQKATGQGQGVKESGGDAQTQQPDTTMPEQGQDSPAQDQSTGQEQDTKESGGAAAQTQQPDTEMPEQSEKTPNANGEENGVSEQTR